MPRNYDQMRDAEDRSFVIRDETFTLRRVTPEEVSVFAEAESLIGTEGYVTHAELAAWAEEQIVKLIDDKNGAVAKWHELRKRKDDPITYGEVADLRRWAVEVLTGFPTMPPEPSVSSPGSTRGSSKAG